MTQPKIQEFQLESGIAGGGEVGSVVPFAMNTVPTGYIACDGTTLSRTTYADLFAAIGTTYGAPSGTTFQVPDLRGEFIRGWDNGRGVDVGRGMGTWQADDFGEHSHAIGDNYVTGNNLANNEISAQVNGTGTVQSSVEGSADTRPRNIAMRYCIKY